MRSLVKVATLPSILFVALAGCASGTDPTDELANATASAGNATAAAGEAYGYFGITLDTRKCASPMCGGWFIKPINQTMIKCLDTYATSCYVPELDWTAANLSEPEQAVLLAAAAKPTAFGGVFAIVRGQLAPTNTTPRPELGSFAVGEAWVAETETTSTGAFVKVRDNGLRCFTTPCPNLSEWTLNMAATTSIAAIDWTPSKLDADQIAACVDAMYSSDGLLVAGHRYRVYDRGTTASGRTANAAYYRVGGIIK